MFVLLLISKIHESVKSYSTSTPHWNNDTFTTQSAGITLTTFIRLQAGMWLMHIHLSETAREHKKKPKQLINNHSPLYFRQSPRSSSWYRQELLFGVRLAPAGRKEGITGPDEEARSTVVNFARARSCRGSDGLLSTSLPASCGRTCALAAHHCLFITIVAIEKLLS